MIFLRSRRSDTDRRDPASQGTVRRHPNVGDGARQTTHCVAWQKRLI
jgi:hypothetical protein